MIKELEFSLCHLLQGGSEAQPEHSQYGLEALSLGLKQPEQKNIWSFTFSPTTHSWQVTGKMLVLRIPYATNYKKESPILNVHNGLN